MTLLPNLWDISLLLCITAIMLLLTSELLSIYYGKINILINRKRLKSTAILFSALFLVTIIIMIAEIMISQ